MPCAQEKQIRARAGMQQLSERMAEQRLQVADRIRRNMGLGNDVRILPRDVEAGLKEFASGVELLVDRLVWSQNPSNQNPKTLNHWRISYSDTMDLGIHNCLACWHANASLWLNAVAVSAWQVRGMLARVVAACTLDITGRAERGCAGERGPGRRDGTARRQVRHRVHPHL